MTTVALLHPELAFSGHTERALALVRAWRALGARVVVIAAPGTRADAVQRAGAELELLELSTAGLARPFVVARVRRVLERAAPDLVHVTHQVLAPLAARIGRPYLQEVHDELTARLPHHPRRMVAGVVSCATLEGACVNQGRVPRAKLRVLRHGPVSTRPARGDRSPPGATLTIGTAGRLVAELGGVVFLRAAQALVGRGLDARFVIYGEGPEEDRLRATARELGLAERVTLTAPSTPEPARLLELCDVYVSSRLAGTPSWLTHEALALGVPTVLSAITGAFAAVEDGVDALLVPRGDPEALARAVAGLAADPSGATALGARARGRRRREAGAFEAALATLAHELVSEGAPLRARR